MHEISVLIAYIENLNNFVNHIVSENFMFNCIFKGESFQDYSRMQNFEADIPASKC